MRPDRRLQQHHNQPTAGSPAKVALFKALYAKGKLAERINTLLTKRQELEAQERQDTNDERQEREP